MQPYQTLISVDQLLPQLDNPDWAIVDCRFSLKDFNLGRQNYLAGHIPGAVFADLNEDLALPHIPGKTGRHPLPGVKQTAALFSRLGIGPGVQVVAYDDQSGALAAVRLWWMLRWLGHESAAVLDGGWQEWNRMHYPVRLGEETRPPRKFTPHPRPELIVTAEEVERLRTDPAYKLLDARASERFNGENETIDPVAGHIPGAVSAPYFDNLNPDGTFRSDDQLREVYERLLSGIPAANTVTYCGSGVTSVHDILAMLHAGLGEGRLYVGSWSEWITDPSRPIATGS
jgi:thiosulfate/3-mercaptopyruvate sulfurtransferase